MLQIILNYLNINIPLGSDPIINFSFGVLIISLALFLTFFKVMSSLITLILINNYDIKNKTKNKILLKFIKTFEGSTLFWIIIETILCIVYLLMLISASILNLKDFIFI